MPTNTPYTTVLVVNHIYNDVLAYPIAASGTAPPARTIAGTATLLASAVNAAQAANGDLYVVDAAYSPVYGTIDAITAYAPGANGNVAPVVDITGTNTGLFGARAVAVDQNGAIYVADCPLGACSGGTNAFVSVFAAGATGNVAPLRTIQGSNTGLAFVSGIAVDRVGNVLVADGTQVAIFPPGASGNVPPSARIAGTNTGQDVPNCVTTDANGIIYVCNADVITGTSSITEYAPGSNGNVAPIRTIAGTNTLLDDPTQIGLDGAGNMYVCDSAGPNLLTVYASNANGNVAPIRAITAPANYNYGGENICGLALGPTSATMLSHARRR